MPRALTLLAAMALLFLAISFSPPASASDILTLPGKVILREATDHPAKGGYRPDRLLSNFILRQIEADDRFNLDTCLAEKGIRPRDYQSLLRAVDLPTKTRSTLTFVRPALEPYCGALYGAHLFRYFLVETTRHGRFVRHRLLLASGGDFFEARQAIHHGLPDFVTMGIGGGAFLTENHYDGHNYRMVSCWEVTAATGGRLRRVKCW